MFLAISANVRKKKLLRYCYRFPNCFRLLIAVSEDQIKRELSFNRGMVAIMAGVQRTIRRLHLLDRGTEPFGLFLKAIWENGTKRIGIRV
jgi:hypothetical protein